MGRIFIMMVAAAKATLMYVALHATALLAGKALVIGKIALVLATVALLKKSFGKKLIICCYFFSYCSYFILILYFDS